MLRQLPLYFLVAVLGTGACGGSGSGPTQPGTAPTPTNFSYLGSVSLPGGVSGMLILRTTAILASLDLARPLAAWLELVEPRLLAQSSAANGALTLSDGTSITLSGTYNAGSFQLSGSEGYAVTASVSGGVLSGTVTTPLGSAAVTPLGFAVPATPPSSTPNGEYVGTYSMTANGFFNNTTVSTGATRACSFQVVITGTLTLAVLSGDSLPSGSRAVHVNDE